MRLLSILSLAALLAAPLVACGDDKPSTPTDTTGADTTGADTTGADTTVADTAAPDTAAPDTTQPPMDTQAPTCVDDNLAGTIANPANLETVLASDPTFMICPGVADYFQVTAAAGEVLKITLITQGVDPGGTTDPGVNDFDMYLYQGSVNEANIVAAAETAGVIEQIVFSVQTPGTYILEVVDYEGSRGGYNLLFGKAVSCTRDADCSGGQICYIGIDDDNLVIAQECQAYTAPACGQGTAEDSPSSSHSDSTAADFAALATNGSFTGTICGPDVDVYAFDLAAGDSVIGSLSATLPADSFMLATWVDGEGNLLEFFELGSGEGSVAIEDYFAPTAGTYYLYLDYLTAGAATADVSYTLDFDVAAACLLDADCSGGEVCGLHRAGIVPTLICAPYKADACGSDDDNSQTNATALTSGVAANGSVCTANPDYSKITLTGASSDLSAVLTWTGAADLDLYLFAPDGTPYGAGWFGANTETVTGRALPAGDYYLLVDEWVDSPDLASTTPKAYTLTVTTSAGTACTQRSDCNVGGIDDNDAATLLSCNAGVCGSVGAGLLSQPPGAACASAGAASAGLCAGGGFCFFGVSCVTNCTTGGQSKCDTDFGGANVAYCETDYWSQGSASVGICIPHCDAPTATTHLWGNPECSATYQTSCDGATNRCVQQQ